MTLTLRILHSPTARSEAGTESGIGTRTADAETGEAAYSGAWRELRRPGEDFGPLAADAWLFASNLRTFR